ncbi:restriction endonuclease subunit S [uncultured Marixanthomonas sp.]|uniref:restriction endonuclease subunit S n=1 Tax=uncultured Marixanthomonas sp. TaxID=757245 RepID=UPI0030DAAF05|tara:strand:- start:38363 stop:40234 length:1872 start_codon:yes stop_codon:yes gene_type:complete
MEIMDSWKQINLGKSATLKARIGWQGLTTAEYLSSGDYYLVTGTDFLNGFIDWDNCVHVEKERYDQDKYIQLQVDDILVTKDGTIGKVAIVDKIVKPTTLNSGVFVIRPLGKSFYPKYLYYILRSGHFADFLSKLTAGSTINHLYQKDFVHYTFPAPPTLEEQRLIANTLSDTDILIQNLKTLIAKKKAVMQGATQELLTGRKRLKGFTGKWETKTIGDIGKVKMCKRIFSYQTTDEGDVPFYKIGTFGKEANSFISKRLFNEFKNKYSYPKVGDILISASGTIGRTVVYDGETAYYQDSNIVWIANDESLVTNSFLYYIYNSMKFNTEGSTIKRLYNNLLLSISFFCPSLQEQKAITQILSDMDSEIEALETQLQKTQNLKQGMMQELLTGKIRLVKPVNQATKKSTPIKLKAKSESEIPSIAAEPEADYKIEKPHNEHITDAVLIGTMADTFGSNEFPLTRFMYTKVSYLLKRFKEEEDNGYLKKAAGPYKPKTRYGGAEKIALQNRYVKKHISNYKGKKYENFVAGDNCTQAIEYFKKWYGENALQWIQQFKYTKRNQLELWATVDMAMQDLLKDNKVVNFQSVKQLINDDKEWRPKLKRPTFSDENIKSAIIKVNQLFG